MMNYPHKVRITAKVTYTVAWFDRHDADSADCELSGYTCPNSRTIFIRTKMSRKRTLQTFIHEIFHALEFEYEIPIPHQMIHDFEEPLARILKLNGWR